MAHTSLSIFMLTLTLATVSQIVKQVSGATLTIANNCSETVWPAINTYTNQSSSSLPISGFTLQRGQSFSLDAPSGWRGMIWGRTLCSTDQSRNFTCVTGDCGSGKLECAGGTDVPPSTTRAEFSVGGVEGRDFYDVTLVDGFNLPMLVAPHQVGGTSSSNCSSAGCLSDVNTVCPPELVVTRSTSGGGVVACKGACGAFKTAEYCCSANSRTCGPTSYSRLFKTACPNAYSYPQDDINTTFVCAAADYVVTFCPSLSNTRSNGSGTVSPSSPNCTSYNCTGNGGTPQPGSGTLSLPLKIGIGIGSALIGILFVCSILYYRTGKSSSSALVVFWKRNTENDEKVEAFILQYGASTPKRYRYADIKKMTNSFEDQLGQGGYGSVFKGRLADGRLVAVKLLNASKGNGEEFVNEVASMGRTSHVNIVSLLGFCYEGRKRALLYEFMPNGSLDKFIYSNNPLEAGQHIGVEKLYDIALGIARGLDYLHRGCNTPILHLDIKPQNILLDDEFCPKIADFGLAKLYNKKKSHVSMLEARGTIGYIAPEVFNRNLAGVSHKSDVYSYGMMMIEIVGGRNNNNAEAVRSSEIYFPNWIYKRLELDEGLQLKGPMTQMENEIARKMMLVGLWCIQTDPSQRPAINKVIDMLEGSMDALEVPPKPFFSSPRQPTTNTSSTFSV